MASATTWPWIRRSACAIHAARRSSSSTRGWAKRTRKALDPEHRAYVPDFGVYIKTLPAKGDKPVRMKISRQLVLFCVERRKAWRLLQSKVGIENIEYLAQRTLLEEVDSGTLSKEELFARAEELLEERILGPAAGKTA